VLVAARHKIWNILI